MCETREIVQLRSKATFTNVLNHTNFCPEEEAYVDMLRGTDLLPRGLALHSTNSIV